MMRRFFSLLLSGIGIAGITSAQADQQASKRNVIIMVADGAGFNAYAAASMYQGKWDAAKGRGTQVYNGPQWKQLAVQTFPLNTSKKPQGTGQQDPVVVYDPVKAWDRTDGYKWLTARYTDSAASASALSTGQKTFNNAINWSDSGQPIKPTISELAKSLGRAAGVVTSVEWSHATPAGFSNAHVAERDEYEEIAKQMLQGGVLDVIMGAGNPDFNNDAKPWEEKKRSAKPGAKKAGEAIKGMVNDLLDNRYQYVGGKETWSAIEAARKTPKGVYQGFRPVSTKDEFEALCTGRVPSKVLGTAQVGTTLQQARAKKNAQSPEEDTPLNPGVPTLTTMAKGALNVLNQNPSGFFLMIEGGAVDWSSHSNHPSRMVQEFADFNLAVEAVVQWVETNSSWEQTLLLITADHETGLLWGPESDKEPFQTLVNKGPGKVPGLLYNPNTHVKSAKVTGPSFTHSNSLVPLFARGVGVQQLDGMVVGTDPVRGPYVDNTSIAKTMQAVMRGE